MTRFLMSLAQSIDLVEYAFENGEPGDLLVRKTPASTIGTIAQALIELFQTNDSVIQTIGFRHG